jgi:uncharacterized protein YeaC (DUF1315 family)
MSGGSSNSVVRSVIAKLAYTADYSELLAFTEKTNRAVTGIKNFGKSLQALNNKQLDSAIKQARLEKERYTAETKKAQLATQQEKISTQQATTAVKQASIESRKLADSIKQQRFEKSKERSNRFKENLDEQRKAMKTLATQAKGTAQAVAAFFAIKVGKWSTGLALEAEQAKIALRAFTTDGQFEQIEKHLDNVRSKTKDFFSESELKSAAAEYFRVDKSVGRLEKSMSVAATMAPLLNKNIGEITNAMSSFYTSGSSSSLEDMGILDSRMMSQMKKEGLDLAKMTREQREAFLDRHIQLSARQKKVAEEAYNGMAGGMKRVKNLFKDFGNALGKKIGPNLNKIINILTRIKSWAKKTGFDQLVLEWTAFAIVGGGILLTLVAVTSAIKLLGLRTIFVKVVTVGWMMATKAATAAMWLMNLAMTAVSLQTWLIIIAVAAVIIGLYALWRAMDGTEAKKVLLQFFGWMKNTLINLWDSLKRTGKKLKKMWDAFDGSDIKNGFLEVLDYIRTGLKNFWKALKWTWEKLEKLWKSFDTTKAKNFFKSGFLWMSNKLKAFWVYLKDTGKYLKEMWSNFSVTDFLSNGLSTVKTKAKAMWSEFSDLSKKIGGFFKDKVFEFGGWGLKKVEQAFDLLWTKIDGIWTKIKDIFKSELFKKAKDLFGKIGIGVLKNIEGRVNSAIPQGASNTTNTNSRVININMGNVTLSVTKDSSTNKKELAKTIKEAVSGVLEKQIFEAMASLS